MLPHVVRNAFLSAPQRLSAKINLKLAKLWLDRREFSRLDEVIRDLHQATEQSEDQQSRGTQLLEIYALEIQMHNEMKNYKKLKASRPTLLIECSICSLYAGNLQCIKCCSISYSTPPDYGCHQGVWGKDVDGRACVITRSARFPYSLTIS